MQASGRRYGAQHPERHVKLWIHNLAAIPGHSGRWQNSGRPKQTDISRNAAADYV